MRLAFFLVTIPCIASIAGRCWHRGGPENANLHKPHPSSVAEMASPAACSVQGTMLSSPWCRAGTRTGASCRAAWLPTRQQRRALVVAAAAKLGGSSSSPAAVQTAATQAATLVASPAAATAAALLLGAAMAGPAAAFEIHAEPANALSLPTWAVHTSSVLEWVTAMGLM